MIASLRGKLLYSDETSVVIECGGVGYRCTVTKLALARLPKAESEVFFHTHMVVREDAMELYGFSDIEELNAFKLVTSVNGVGAKMGIALLSQFSASQMLLYIASGDSKALTAASGVGMKLAQRIILELKDKVGSVEASSSADITAISSIQSVSNASEAIEALIALGYTKGEASLAVSRLDSNLSSGELIKLALKSLARR